MPRFLVIKPSSFGDIIHGLQAVESLRQQVPNITVDWVVRDIFAPIVETCLTVERSYLFRRNDGWKGFYDLSCQLWRQKYDWVWDMQGLFRSGLLTLFSKADRKAGRADARELAWLFYGKKPEMPAGGKNAHALDILLQFLPLVGARPELQGKLQFKPQKEAFEFFTFHKIFPQARPIVLFPDSRRAEKEWPFFAELTDRILKRYTDRPIVWAGNNPRYCANTVSLRGDNFFNLVGKTSLTQLPILLEKAQIVICNDSGPMHLAAAIGTPVLAFFGPTDPHRYGPYPLSSSRHHVLVAPEGNLRQLSVESVESRLTSVIG